MEVGTFWTPGGLWEFHLHEGPIVDQFGVRQTMRMDSERRRIYVAPTRNIGKLLARLAAVMTLVIRRGLAECRERGTLDFGPDFRLSLSESPRMSDEAANLLEELHQLCGRMEGPAKEWDIVEYLRRQAKAFVAADDDDRTPDVNAMAALRAQIYCLPEHILRRIFNGWSPAAPRPTAARLRSDYANGGMRRVLIVESAGSEVRGVCDFELSPTTPPVKVVIQEGTTLADARRMLADVVETLERQWPLLVNGHYVSEEKERRPTPPGDSMPASYRIDQLNGQETAAAY